MFTLNKKPAGVVSKVAYPVVELALTKENLIVVFRDKEDAVVAVLAIGIGVLTLHSNIVQNGQKSMEGVAAACLEAVEDVTDMAGEMVGDEENGVEVIRHKLKGEAGHLGDTDEHALPVGNDSLAKRGRDGVGSVRIAIGTMHVAHDLAKERLAAFCDHGYQVDTASAVVVTFQSARHRFLLLSGEKLLSPSCLFIHSF